MKTNLLEKLKASINKKNVSKFVKMSLIKTMLLCLVQVNVTNYSNGIIKYTYGNDINPTNNSFILDLDSSDEQLEDSDIEKTL